MNIKKAISKMLAVIIIILLAPLMVVGFIYTFVKAGFMLGIEGAEKTMDTLAKWGRS